MGRNRFDSQFITNIACSKRFNRDAVSESTRKAIVELAVNAESPTALLIWGCLGKCRMDERDGATLARLMEIKNLLARINISLEVLLADSHALFIFLWNTPRSSVATLSQLFLRSF